MSDKELVPVPEEEQLQKIDEAFEVERPDASIAVVDPPTPNLDDLSGALMSVLALEEKLEAIEDTKQNRANRTQIGLAMVGVAKLSVWGMIGWFTFVGLAIAAYMFGTWRGVVLLPENALLALIGTVAFATILGAVAKVIEALKTDPKQS